MLLKCFHTRDHDMQMSLFNAFVRPILEYNPPVWSPHLIKDINVMERVQKFFTKNLCGLKSLPYIIDLLFLNNQLFSRAVQELT